MIPEDLAYLHHICDAITHIEDFSKNISTAAELTDSVLERAGVERMLITIGEAVKNLSHRFAENTRTSHGGKPPERGTRSFTIILA